MMKCQFSIFIYEDLLSEVIVKTILRFKKPHLLNMGTFLPGNGYGTIRKNLKSYNKTAKSGCIFIFTDLDQFKCPPNLISNWAGTVKLNEKLVFCIAIKEIETWLMASRTAFSKYLGIKTNHIPQNIEDIPDPKAFLFTLVRKSPHKSLKKDILPDPKNSAKIGKGYNHALTRFVVNYWDIEEAKNNSLSLSRTIKKIAAISL